MRSKLVSPTGRDIVLRPVPANAGLVRRYRKKLLALLEEMQRSIVFWISASYRKNITTDSEISEIGDDLRKLGDRWEQNFAEASEKMADWFAHSVRNYSDPALKKILADSGFSIPFEMSGVMQNALDATVIENVALIKSIGKQHFDKIERLVVESASRGRDLEYMTKALREEYGLSKRRAELIARDQNNKATEEMNRARRLDLGITEAIWRHSNAGNVPRKSHVAASGKKFDVEKGCLIDGEYIQPGQLINCRCTSSPVIPGFRRLLD